MSDWLVLEKRMNVFGWLVLSTLNDVVRQKKRLTCEAYHVGKLMHSQAASSLEDLDLEHVEEALRDAQADLEQLGSGLQVAIEGWLKGPSDAGDEQRSIFAGCPGSRESNISGVKRFKNIQEHINYGLLQPKRKSMEKGRAPREITEF